MTEPRASSGDAEKESRITLSNRVIGSNRVALDAANRKAKSFGYRVLDLGARIEGETREVAVVVAGIVRSIQQ